MRHSVGHSLVKALRGVPDFAALDDGALLHIVGASANLYWPVGERIFSTGSPAEALYIVLAGEVRILDHVDGDEVEVARVGPGDSFGEISLLQGSTHTKDAVAAEDSELMVIPREPFRSLVESNPELGAHFRRKLEDRAPIQGEAAG